MRLLHGGVALVSLCVAFPLFSAENEALQQLQRLSQAAQTRNYEGTFVYLHSNHLESVRIVHGVDAKGEHERLITLSGKSREVIRENGEVKSFFSDDHALHLDKARRTAPLPLIKTPQVERISHLYQFELKGHERVAGRETAHVAVIPRDNYRYGRGYWIDDEAGLLLRADLIDDRGRVVEQMMFTTIQLLSTIPRKSLLPENSAKEFVVIKPADAHTPSLSPDEAQWEAETLPPGFELEMLRHLTLRDHPVEHHVYGDGLASISVFIEPAGNEKEFVGPSRMGAVNAYAQRVGESRVVVVGEVPAVTVERIAGAMRLRTKDENHD